MDSANEEKLPNRRRHQEIEFPPRTPPPVIENDPVPLRIDESEAVRVGRTRVTLETLVGFYQMGHTPEEILQSFPTLELADIYSVIGYYLRHREVLDAYLAQCEIEGELIRQAWEAVYPPPPNLKEQLLARRAAQQAAAQHSATEEDPL